MTLSMLVNRAKMGVSGTPGTGVITLASAITGFQSFVAAGVLDGQPISYVIEDGANWEVGQGLYTASGTTLTRTTVLASNNSNLAISATNAAQVYATALASDLQALMLNDNRIINGNFAINQRAYASAGSLAAAAYGHDRWKAGASGCTYTFTPALADTTITITANTLTQVIEAGFIEGGVYTLSWTGTAQARVYQGSPTGSYAASPIVTGSLSAGTAVIVEFNAGTLTRVKFEIGSFATPFNRQSLAKSEGDCERYFRWIGFDMQFTAAAAMTLGQTMTFQPAMRVAPTIGTLAADPNTAQTALNTTVNGFDSITSYSARTYLTATGAGPCVLIGYRASATAEL